MLSWSEILKLIDGRWLILKSDRSSVTLSLSVDGAARKVMVELTTLRQRPVLIVTVDICPRHKIDPLDALRYNASAEGGALAVLRGACVLRHVLPLESLASDALVSSIRAGADDAARWARKFVRSATPATVFGAVFAYLAE